MFLKSLTVARGDGTMIRDIQFHIGSNLIVDETPIVSETIPIGDLPGFDSLASVAVTCQCLDRFGLANHTEIMSIFIGKDGMGFSFALNVTQVANIIVELLA